MGYRAQAISAVGVLLLTTVPLFAASGAIVVQMGRAFRPVDVTINKGKTVTFTNNDSFIHQIYVDGLFDSEEKARGRILPNPFRASEPSRSVVISIPLCT